VGIEIVKVPDVQLILMAIHSTKDPTRNAHERSLNCMAVRNGG
jgi:hypothetical protein